MPLNRKGKGERKGIGPLTLLHPEGVSSNEKGAEVEGHDLQPLDSK